MMKRQPPPSNEFTSGSRLRPLAWEKGNHRVAQLNISLPRGKVATLEFDGQAEVFVTNHEVLFKPFFQKGVLDFEGVRRMPLDGYEFLRTLYDRLFLTGYSVTWKWVNHSPKSDFSMKSRM